MILRKESVTVSGCNLVVYNQVLLGNEVLLDFHSTQLLQFIKFYGFDDVKRINSW